MTPHEGDQGVDGRTVEEEDEDMVEVGVLTEDGPPGAETRGDDTEEGTPTHTVFVPAAADSDSSSEDENPLSQPQARGMPIGGMDTGVGMGINGDLGMDVGDGSDSDGMEDIAPPFPPPIQPQYTNGAANGNSQNQAPEPSPVSALENLWVIDP